MELRCTQHFPNTNSQHPSKNTAAAAKNSQNLLASVSKLCFCFFLFFFFLLRSMHLSSQQNNWEEVKCDPMKSLSLLTAPGAITQHSSNELQLEFPRSKLFKQTSWKQTEEQSYQWPLMGFQRVEAAQLTGSPKISALLGGSSHRYLARRGGACEGTGRNLGFWGVRSRDWGNTPVLHLLKNDLISQSI